MPGDDERSEYDRQSLEDAKLATMFRVDVDRLKTIRRVVSGVARCPNCDKVNPAENRFCQYCGAKLYPAEEEEEKLWKIRRDDDSEKL
ncbi:MAG TPA: zinc ribbon domain-containing protein [Thermoplasmata archaeon]|jgi:ribosomal protein L32